MQTLVVIFFVDDALSRLYEIMPEPALNIVPFPEPTALDVYCQFFTDFVPSPFQQDILEQAVTDLKIWKEACFFWAANAYRPQSIGKLIEYYEQLMGKRAPRFENSTGNGIDRAHVGKHDENAPERPVEIPTCIEGHEYCLRDHRYDQVN